MDNMNKITETFPNEEELTLSGSTEISPENWSTCHDKIYTIYVMNSKDVT